MPEAAVATKTEFNAAAIACVCPFGKGQSLVYFSDKKEPEVVALEQKKVAALAEEAGVMLFAVGTSLIERDSVAVIDGKKAGSEITLLSGSVINRPNMAPHEIYDALGL